MSRNERLLLWSLAAAAVVLRALAFFRYRFDSDEQQHLHVAWGWTEGLVQYRDLFDNHTPLFHMTMAPLVALFGERSDILLWMRLPMLGLFAFVLWATYAIGRKLYDERVAIRAVFLLALFPPFFLKSLEFRTDNLLNALWMAALLLLIGGKLSPRRSFFAAFILGCAFSVSLKTLLLAGALVVAALVTGIVTNRDAGGADWRRRALRAALPALAGFAIVPAILAAYFASAGAWDRLVFCNITFNGNVALTRRYAWVGRAIFPFTSAGLVYLAWRFRRTREPRRYLFAVAMGVFTVTLAGFWLLISPRDFLPLMPLAAIFAAAALDRLDNPLRAFAVTSALLIAALYYYADRFENNTDWHVTMMNQALGLTRPGEPLMDLKGETIFRQRPFYFVFENITRAQMARGIIRDTVAADVIRTRTHVAQADGPMWPPAARAFLHENFVDMGRLRVSGQWFRNGEFTIAVPGSYVILTARGAERGMLNGTPYRGAPIELAAGPYRFVPETPAPEFVVVWAPAVARGYSPFHLRDREY